MKKLQFHVGFADTVEKIEVKRLTVALSREAFDFVDRLTREHDFKSSNGFVILCSSTYKDELKDDRIFMSEKTFRGNKVVITEKFDQKKCELVWPRFKVALQELAQKLKDLKTENIFEGMETF